MTRGFYYSDTSLGRFASQVFTIFSIILVKVSIISFYRSIFATAGFRRMTNIAFITLAATLIALFFVTLFQDSSAPFDNRSTDTTIINGLVFYLFTAVLEVAYDLAVLCFPLPMIRGLQLSRRRKWSIVGIFWLGGLWVSPKYKIYGSQSSLQMYLSI